MFSNEKKKKLLNIGLGYKNSEILGIGISTKYVFTGKY